MYVQMHVTYKSQKLETIHYIEKWSNKEAGVVAQQ